MGGCCCSSRGGGLDRTPAYFYCPRTAEERQPLASTQDTPTAVSAGLLVDVNLMTSIPDTYRAPPAPMPYDMDSQQLVGADGSFENPDAGSLKKSDFKIKTDCGLDSSKLIEDEPSKLGEPIASDSDEEDVCPTCLEEYDGENPRIITKCEHHFHLSCILEWKERSDTCPVCDQIMEIEAASATII